MPDLIDYIAELDENEESHLARLLVLIKAFQKEDKAAIEGITKLAKLDFLLRYPSYFEVAMRKRGASEKSLQIAKYERNSIEAKMVRYKFGPWDHRYRRFLNVLAGKGLATLTVEGRTISVDLTKKGEVLAAALASQEEFIILRERADLLNQRLDIAATKIMNFIYDTFPELHNLDFNTEIDSEQLL